jgi:hypothetical protein
LQLPFLGSRGCRFLHSPKIADPFTYLRFRQVNSRISALRLRKSAQAAQCIQSIFGAVGIQLCPSQPDSVLDVVRKEIAQRLVDLHSRRELTAQLPVPPFDRQTILSPQLTGKVKCSLGFFPRTLVVA